METNQSSLLGSIREAIRGPGWVPGRRRVEGPMPSLAGATAWLNSPPLTSEGLRSRVVVIDFWTFTCINWLRTAPYVRAWSEAYRDAGLVVLGVHTPEFSFEGDVDNVRREVASRGITYPVAVDSDHAIWTSFANMYWPALYIADAEGNLRYHHFGEGAYEESEQVIRQLLAEAGAGEALPQPVTVEADGIEAAADWRHLGSPENYLGAERTEGFASPERTAIGVPGTYSIPSRLAADHWALAGEWTVQRENVVLERPDGRLACRFSARDLHAVMAPPVSAVPVRFTVRLDGRRPGDDHGDDVDDDGTGTLTEPRLHQLVRQRGPVTDRTFEISFSAPGARAYAFTFG
jgi:thiol-disulfide isomerase/thioredoxin